MLWPNGDLRGEQSNHPREFEDFLYAYPVLSRRSNGVSIGLNLNLDKHCNFDCPYCQVDRTIPKARQPISIPKIRLELERILESFDDQGICRIDRFVKIPESKKMLRDIALSGDGEPTMIPEFPKICEMLLSLQTAQPNPFFKLILISNSSFFNKSSVLEGIGYLLSKNGEVWAKLDAGTEEWYQKVNVSRISLDQIEKNLIMLGKAHPYKIQSLFCGLDGQIPSTIEVQAFLERLQRIKAAGSKINEVQLHTLARKPAQASCTPVPVEFLRMLKNKIENESKIPANIYALES
jgi:wyosine [tRNA(Phe)-imidazoG37] synthetase (radical SAM superfamily)